MRRGNLVSLSLLATVGSVGCVLDGGAEAGVSSTPLRPAPTAQPDDVVDRDGDPPLPSGSCWQQQQPVGADPLGPPVSHGLHASPGYRPDQFDPVQERAFRAATLQETPSMGMLYWSGIELPSADPSGREMERLADAAVRLAGHSLPATPLNTMRREIRNEDSTQRTWSVGFTHGGVRVSPAGCVVRVESGKTTCASLSCQIPTQRLVRFEPFSQPDALALARARRASGLLRATSTDLNRLYLASESLAEARFYVILSNGRQEHIVVLDGAANVLTVGDNTRGFTFRGYEPDYLTPPQTLDTSIPVGSNQSLLDTAPAQANRVNCEPPSSGVAYKSGFAICYNDALRDPFTSEYTQDLVAPRADFDFSNPASVLDSLPAQDLFFYGNAASVAAAHGTLTQVTGIPKELGPWLDYARLLEGQGDEQPYGPAHHAELQAYYNMAKLQSFYSFFDPRFSPGGQDRFRTEVTVHWRPAFDDLHGWQLNNARAGRFMLQVADAGVELNLTGWEEAMDGTGEFSVFAHEYHHHVQESLARDEGWTPFPGFKVLFPHDEVECTPAPDCKRRVHILEGLADAFGELAVGRGVHGTSSAPNLSLPDMLSKCDDREGFSPISAIPQPLSSPAAPLSTPRLLCTSRVFGGWEVHPTDPCFNSSFQYDLSTRRSVVGGGLHLYQRRFREAGVGPVVYGQHMLEAQRVLKQLTANEMAYFSGLVNYLRSQPSVLTRRYEHTARAAFAEKGVFSTYAHFVAAGTLSVGLDERQEYQCSSSNCTPARARTLSAATLTASGPLRWNFDPDLADVPIPTFEIFAPIGSAYDDQGLTLTQNRVWLEFSDAPDFTGGTFFERTPVIVDALERINCAPPGFARPTVPSTIWRDAVRAAADADGRVYYRLRQCLDGASVDDPDNCIVSTTATSPAFTTVSFQGGTGCTCELPGRPLPRPGWPAAVFAAACASLVLRKKSKPA